ncbi:MAG: peptidoglycan DD-metalloendopeptidase family protein [Anaerolineaceae bacterium]
MKNKLFAVILSFLLIFSFISSVKAQDQTQFPTYVIQAGDTLASIADRFYISLEDLKSFNGITNADFISVGTPLIIPGLQELHGQISTSPVQLGETLKDLSIKYQIAQNVLLKINRVTNPGTIQVGSSLILPVVDETKSRVPVNKVNPSQTILEIAVLDQIDPWNLLDQNNIKSTSNIFANDLLYLPRTQGLNEISTIDPKLTSVTISPLPLVQGETFEISVDAPQQVTLTGTLNGMPLHFFSIDENKQVALQGIHAMAEPGVAPFKLSGTFADGNSFIFEQSVLLVSGNYPIDDPLTVAPELIDPAVTQPEEDQVKQITSIVTPTRYWSGIFKTPAYYNESTSTFGDRRTYNNGAFSSFHGGLDFAGGMGLPIKSPADGVVVFAGPLTVRGNATIIDHGWGIFTAYFHQSEIEVKIGDFVKMGQEIGKVGNTGRVNDADAFIGAGAHLHWEFWVNGIQVNPIQWLNIEYP